MTEIILPCGRTLLIDKRDLPLLEGRRWFSVKKGNTYYVMTRKPGQRNSWDYIHRLILNNPPQCDHKNGNGLDNRRANLRACTVQQNQFNRSRNLTKRFKGVYYDKRSEAWFARLSIGGRVFYGSYHDAAVAAAKDYNRLATEHFGEFARLNQL